jgi:hypothetical protein
MIAYKILRPGAVAPFSRVRWPLPARDRPGAWVHGASSGPRICQAGVHACGLAQLPFWLGEELWRVELAEPVRGERLKLVAPAGRLVGRIAAWDEGAALAFAADTTERIRAMDTGGYIAEAEVFCVGELAEADPFAAAAVSTMVAVECAEHAGGHGAVAAERALQSAWLAERLGLSEVLA